MGLPEYFWQVLLEADKIGVRLEMVGGVPMWEAMPSPRHQREVKRIEASIRRAPDGGGDCACVSLQDVAIRFPDDSFKRPDISVFCREPEEEDEATRLIPEAVIEVLSPGYESKDLTFGGPFYLAQGVKDVLIFDPRTLAIVHMRKSETLHLISPQHFRLECGCEVDI